MECVEWDERRDARVFISTAIVVSVYLTLVWPKTGFSLTFNGKAVDYVVCFLDDRECTYIRRWPYITRSGRRTAWTNKNFMSRQRSSRASYGRMWWRHFCNPLIATRRTVKWQSSRSAVLDNRAAGRWRRFRVGAGRYIDWRHIVSTKYAIIAPLSILVALTLSSPVASNGYTSKCSGPYWSHPPFLIFWHCPNVKKLRRVG